MRSLILAALALISAAAHAADPPALSLGACAVQADGTSVCPLTVPAPPVVPPPPPTYVAISKEGGTFTLLESQIVRYGAAGKWAEKALPAGVATACSNATFGDPIFGTAKRCEVRGGPPIELTAPSVVEMPPTLDHSKMAVTIDPALLAAVAPAVGASSPRVRTTWHHEDWSDCDPHTAGCFVVDAEKPLGPQDIGAFREPVEFAMFGNFDPIVNATTPQNDSHPHTFLGNTCINRFTTPETLVAPGCGSMSAGGSLNLTAYWVPTLVDTAFGRPLVPLPSLIYYKCSYEFDTCPDIQLMPVGLRLVVGNASNTDPSQAAGDFSCAGPNGEQGPTAKTIAGALEGGACKAGGVLHVGIVFPYCWDGVNLDSPNHNAHVSRPEDYIAVKLPTGAVVEATAGTPGSYYGKRCPASHPVVLPVISYSLGFAITDDGMVGRVRAVSDAAGAAAGTSFHADYYMGWNPDIGRRWVTNCLRARMDCHAYLLGDGFELY